MNVRIVNATTVALRATAEPRFFMTERGYQGRFYCALQAELDRSGLLIDGVILEMEYQKSGRHDLNQRPDIVLHVPAEVSGAAVTQNNHAVFALKRKATRTDARNDFDKLDHMCAVLKYQLAIFINVASREHHGQYYTGSYRERMRSFAVELVDGIPTVSSWSGAD